MEKARRSVEVSLEQQAADAAEVAKATIEAAATRLHGTRKKARAQSAGRMQNLMTTMHQLGYLAG